MVPSGVALEPGTAEYFEQERLGISQLGKCGFVLVAGGLGERLGFSGIKLSLPTENILRKSYIQLYCQYILALQAKHGAGAPLPLAIMLSDDTDKATKLLFAENNNFGLSPDQLHFMKQEAVAALSDNDARLAREEGSLYSVSKKPHGHGDVHALMYSSGVAAAWAAQGVEWCYFFQDTNALAFMSLPIMIGVSLSHGFVMNSMAVPRKAKQAVGGIVRLEGPEGSMTINVEYNQLDPLLRANGFLDGDINDPVTGLSPYPGNINELLFKMGPYLRVLQSTHGVVGEFVNPKYADSTRLVFKKPTRLECMMQDFPKAREVDSERVGFTQAPSWFCYTPVKNAQSSAIALAADGIPPACPMSGESDLYGVFSRLLRLFGCVVEEESEPATIAGITASLGPRILVDPTTAVTVSDIKKIFKHPESVHITARSTLYLCGNIEVDSLSLDGSLFIENSDPAVTVIVRTCEGTFVHNKGHRIAVIAEPETSAVQSREQEIRRMFGYDIIPEEMKQIRIISGAMSPGKYVFDGQNLTELL